MAKNNLSLDESPVARRFYPLLQSTGCPYAELANISFGPEWSLNETFHENIARLLPAFHAFAERSLDDNSDMFVAEVRDPMCLINIHEFARFLNKLLTKLSQFDSSSATSVFDGIESPEWDFSYKGLKFFVLTFAPFYHKCHGRYSHRKETAFVTFQPDHSFDRFGIHKASPIRRKLSRTVRDAFLRKGMPYHYELVTGSIKALRYIQPLEVGHAPVRWWEVTDDDAS